jgi:predicted small lipoprotein YifL
MRIILLLVLIALASLAACGESTPTPPSPVPQQQPPAQPGDASRGQVLFQQPLIGVNNAPGCANCHSLTPGVVLVGPSPFY